MHEIKVPVSGSEAIALNQLQQTEGAGNFRDCPRIQAGETLQAGKHLERMERHVVSCEHLRAQNTCDRLNAPCPVQCVKGMIGTHIYKILVHPPQEIEIR